MELIQPYTFEKLSTSIQTELRKAVKLYYVPDESIVITDIKNKETIPTFENYLIKISVPDSGFVIKIPRIGNYYRNIYIVAIELWIKSSENLAKRIISGNTEVGKGIFEFFQDVSDTLEHNNFDGQLDNYPGTNIQSPTTIKSEDNLLEGVAFLWMGNQNNLK